LPDVRDTDVVDDPRHGNSADQEARMSVIQVTVIEGVFTAAEKQEIVERLTDAMAAIEGEGMRRHILCLVTEVGSGDWGIGGQTVTTDDARALARSGPVDQP
jgi:4-oxalocrotonate tautomerase